MTDYGTHRTVEGMQEFDVLAEKYPALADVINRAYLNFDCETNKVDELGYFKHTIGVQLNFDATSDFVNVTVHTDYRAAKPTQAIFNWERFDSDMLHKLDGESTVYDLPIGKIHPRMLELHRQFAVELAAKYVEQLLLSAELITA
jgi:hypothetical protein